MRKRDNEHTEYADLAARFKALGDPTRLRIFQFLRACHGSVAVGKTGEVSPLQGPTAGEVCCQVTGAEKITSSISFHLKELRRAGLITMERRGKHMICGVDPEALDQLAAFFGEQKSAEGAACC